MSHVTINGILVPNRTDTLYIPELTDKPIHISIFDPMAHEYHVYWNPQLVVSVHQSIKQSWFIKNPDKWCVWDKRDQLKVHKHSWFHYIGFTEKYKYCTECGIKDYSILNK